MTLDLWVLAISVAALGISARALRTAGIARLQALRTEVRRDMDTASAEASKLIVSAVALTEETMQAVFEITTAEGDEFRPDEREAFDLRRDAKQPLAELQHIDCDLRAKSRKQLEAMLKDIARVRGLIHSIRTKIDIKNAALDRLRGTVQAPGEAADRKVVLKSFGQESEAGKAGA